MANETELAGHTLLPFCGVKHWSASATLSATREPLRNIVCPTQAICDVRRSPVTTTIGCTFVQGSGLVSGEIIRMISPLRVKPTYRFPSGPSDVAFGWLVAMPQPLVIVRPAA